MEQTKVIVGLGSCGIAAGARKVYNRIKTELKTENLDFKLKKTSCIGMCYREPLVEVIDEKGSYLYGDIDEKKAIEIIEQHVKKHHPIKDYVVHSDLFKASDNDFVNPQVKIVLRNCGFIDPEKIAEYEARNGYRAIRKIAAPGLRCRIWGSKSSPSSPGTPNSHSTRSTEVVSSHASAASPLAAPIASYCASARPSSSWSLCASSASTIRIRSVMAPAAPQLIQIDPARSRPDADGSSLIGPARGQRKGNPLCGCRHLARLLPVDEPKSRLNEAALRVSSRRNSGPITTLVMPRRPSHEPEPWRG